MSTQRYPWALVVSLLIFPALGAGCLRRHHVEMAPPADVATELNRITLPDHLIAPPDILLIDAISLVPRPPYLIKPLDGLFIQVSVPGAKDEDKRPGLIPGQPIEGIHRVEPDGTVELGFDYGSVKVVGMQIAEARKQIKGFLQKRFKGDFEVTVSLTESRAMQQIRGEHLVQPDGKINLGSYGSVYITGLTVEQAREAIQEHLSKTLQDPEISLSIAGFNSRVYYIIFDQAGAGEQVYRLPSTGNETVLDAVAELKGLPPGTYRKRIWVARPYSTQLGGQQILPVDWEAVSSGGSPTTNYQLLPGDRLFVSVDPCIRLDNNLAKILSPIERILGITLLGARTVQEVSGQNNGGNGF